MLIKKAYKFRLEPTVEQEKKMAQFAGCVRYVWNRALALQKELLKMNKRASYPQLCKHLTNWKKEPDCQWLNQAPIHALQQALKNLDIGYQRFFNKALQAEEPVFKKKGKRSSFKESDPACFYIEGNYIKLPKLGLVKFRKSREIIGLCKNVTISKHGKHWFISIQVEYEVLEPVHQSRSAVGIDVGIAKFATLSDGTEIAPCNSFRMLEQQLVRLQRKLARKVKFSNNWRKLKAKIQELCIKIANVRRDFLQKVSTQICKNHAVIVMEDLKIANMSKSSKGTVQDPGKNVKAKSGLNKSILDQGWHSFREMILYKQLWNGGKVIFVPPHYTSQRCHMCGHTEKANRPTQKKFACVCCGYSQNADVNAAQNILAVGHTVLACGDIRWVTT